MRQKRLWSESDAASLLLIVDSGNATRGENIDSRAVARDSQKASNTTSRYITVKSFLSISRRMTVAIVMVDELIVHPRREEYKVGIN